MTVRIVFKNVFTAIAPVHEMVDGAGILDVELRGIEQQLPKQAAVSMVMIDAFFRFR